MADEREDGDEVWVTEDGDRIPVADLSEKEVKGILRMILRSNRERTEHFERDILPNIKDALSDMFQSMGEDAMMDPTFVFIEKEPQEPGITSMSDIDDIFVKHGASLNKH